MASGGKKRKLGVFEEPKDEKITKMIDSLKREYILEGFKIEKEDDKPTGFVHCIGSCRNKNAEFSAKGSRYVVNPMILKKHVEKYHNLINPEEKAKIKKIDKNEIIEIQKMSASIIADNHLALDHYNNPKVIKRDEKIIECFEGNKEIASSVSLTRYKCKKLFETSSSESLSRAY
ncbi:unnamed protein product [Oikopleura dioica]|uniref:Uncharacterized protein n=1 Tax=Oikopleura dioica TaxID=34765 RepID=E4WSX7_OIKDI|nr:unnamed protein product [Oikopleura dioica]